MCSSAKFDANDRQVVSVAFRQHLDMAGIGYMTIGVMPIAKEQAA